MWCSHSRSQRDQGAEHCAWWLWDWWVWPTWQSWLIPPLFNLPFICWQKERNVNQNYKPSKRKRQTNRHSNEQIDRHFTKFNLKQGQRKNKPAGYTTSLAYEVWPTTGEMIACKRTNRCIIMDKVGHNGKMTIAFDMMQTVTMNSLKDSLSLSQKDLYWSSSSSAWPKSKSATLKKMGLFVFCVALVLFSL